MTEKDKVINPVIFQSFYNDPTYTSLKHALLFFDEVRLIDFVFSVAYEDEDKSENTVAVVNLTPEYVKEELELLRKEKIVRIFKLESKDKFSGAPDLWSEIVRFYPEEEIPNVRTLEGIPITELPNNFPNSSDPLLPSIIGCSSWALIRALLYWGIPPCFDSRLLFDFLRLRYLELHQNPILIKLVNETLQEHRFKEDFLTQKLGQIYLPTFETMSFDDLLEVRNRTSEERSRFRRVIYDLASDIEISPWSSKFEKHIDHLIKVRLEPTIRDLTNNLEFSTSKVIKSTVRNIFRARNVLSWLIYPILPSQITLAILTAWPVIAAVQEEIERIKTIKQENGLSFLISVSSHK